MIKISNLMNKIVLILSSIIVAFLFAQSLFTNVRLDQYEHVYFISGSLLDILGFIVLIVITFFLFAKANVNEKHMNIIIGAYFIFTVVFVLMAENYQHSDMLHVLECASQISDGNYSSLENGGYLNIFTVQHGIVLLFVLLSTLFGNMNIVALQALNAVMVIVCICCLRKFWDDYEYTMRHFYLVAVICCVPIVLYVSVVYGTIIGLSLSVMAIVYQQRYFCDNRIKNVIISDLLIVSACVIKSNYKIFLIAIILLYFFNISKNNFKKNTTILFSLILFNIFISIVSISILPAMSGNINYRTKGCSMMAWLAIGLSDDSAIEAGWFDGYTTSVWEAAGYNTEKSKELAEAKVMELTKYWVEHPKEYCDFLHRKIASTWCDPSFQGMYFNGVSNLGLMEKHGRIYEDIVAYSGKLHRIIYVFLESFHLFILFGTLYYCISSVNNSSLNKNIGLLIFLGGVVFHLFWEVKSMYAFIFFVPIIPYAISGYRSIYEGIFESARGINYKRGILSIIFLIGLVVLGFKIKIDMGDTAWNEWLKNHRYVRSQRYELESKTDGAFSISDVNIQADMSDAWYYVLDSDIDVLNGQWKIEREGGAYLLRKWDNQNMVLTYDSDNLMVYLENYKYDNKSQLWVLK